MNDLTTADIETFSAEHFPANPPVRVEWIDDSKANIVFDTPATGLKALANFGAPDSSILPILQPRPAKILSTHPEAILSVRIAVTSDQKQSRAHEASRFYMMHPEHDPRERRRRAKNNQGDGYRKRRYDDDEHRRRRHRDQVEGFDASMYDDNESTGRRSSVTSSSRERPHRLVDSYRPNGGTSRDRSASPTARDTRNRRRTPPPPYSRRDPYPFPKENGSKELFPDKTQKSGNESGKELFPLKASTVLHRRSDAIDAAYEVSDLFPSKVQGAQTNGSGKSRPLGERITSPGSDFGRLHISDPNPDLVQSFDEEEGGMSIRGSSRDPGMSIRGGAIANGPTVGKVRELFPQKASANAGKELFAERLQGRGGRRNRAEDMFS